MTQMGLDYLKYKETQRSNLATEAETKRSNVARETETNRHNVITEDETNRHNLVTEAETNRSNLARETETNRSNLANEAETHRANVARETETHRSNVAKEVETNRANVAKETETNRANLAKEQETNRANIAKETQNAIDSKRDYETSWISAWSRYPETVKYIAAALYGTGKGIEGVNNTAFVNGVAGFMESLESIFGLDNMKELRTKASNNTLTPDELAVFVQEQDARKKAKLDNAIAQFEKDVKEGKYNGKTK